MKAMILAAGRGERMRPLTDEVPKPLLKVRGKSIIEYHIEALVKSGIDEIVINHAWLGSQIEATLGDGSHYNAQIQYSPEYETGLETGGGIFNALPLLGDNAFIIVNGDIWTDYPFESLVNTDIKESHAHLVLINNPPHHPGGDFILDDSRLFSDEKSYNSSCNQVKAGNPMRLTYSGIGIYQPILFEDCKPGIFPLAPLLRRAMESGNISGEIYQGRWSDVGTPERLNELNSQD